MKTQKNQKRLHIAAETLRTLRADEVQNIVGGAAGNDAPGGGEAGFTNSISISWRGNNCCNCG